MRSLAARALGTHQHPTKLTIFSQFSTSHKNAEYGQTFDKILIANRGEIACRVMRSAKKMGIKTVAVYSDADADALHVRMADEAVHVGPAPSAKSYLNIPAILNAVLSTGAQAVHPGYGFLSENATFVDALEKANVAFIGPNSSSMQKMGDKIESKRIAAEAGVHTIPGWEGVVRDEEHAIELAKEIGYPVMLKASAGGGGKGMRIAWYHKTIFFVYLSARNEKEIRENFRLAAAEAKASFADDRLLIERFIESPRHIEIQLIGDKHGNTLYLPERECSIQRRNQKVIEEAPSVAIDQETRDAMGRQAVQLAKAVGYHSAGTVEFLVDAKRRFYFLEMNTRLQVEHPITELVSGIDLVEQMIRVAAGQQLAFRQKDIKINGWAVESRVYAEDPRTYLPCVGRLTKYVEPSSESQSEIVRCDSGIEEGTDIPVFYDPLICKLSTHGPNRDAALNTMQRALDSYVIQGVTHNIPLLREVVGNAQFRSGKFSTNFLKENYPEGFQGHQLRPEELNVLASVATKVYWARADREHAKGKAEREPLEVKIGEQVLSDPVNVEMALEWKPESPLIKVKLGSGATVTVQYLSASSDGILRLQHMGTIYDVQVRTAREAGLSRHMVLRSEADTSDRLRSPMPGQIVQVLVKEGQEVAPGAELLVIEAMKMQNVLRASRAGKISRVHVTQGQNVAAEQDLVVFA